MAVTPNSIVTPQTPRSAHLAQSFSANTTLIGVPVNTALLLSSGPNGARLTKLRALPVGTVSATQLQIFRSLDGGVTKKLVNMHMAPAYTYAPTTAPTSVDFGYSDGSAMIMAPSEELHVAVAVSGPWSFEAEWADY